MAQPTTTVHLYFISLIALTQLPFIDTVKLLLLLLKPSFTAPKLFQHLAHVLFYLSSPVLYYLGLVSLSVLFFIFKFYVGYTLPPDLTP